jgi:predicted Zn-dependent protease
MIELKNNFNRICDLLFSRLTSDLRLNINLTGEDSLFIRFNNSKVRQCTDVSHYKLSCTLQNTNRRINFSFNLQSDLAADSIMALREFEVAHANLLLSPEDPFLVQWTNNGTSESIYKGQLLPADNLISQCQSAFENLDMAGLYCGGQIHRANRNSLGQSHWFSTENFFLDYSLYNGASASKGIYAGKDWNSDALKTQVLGRKRDLDLLNRPKVKLKPGRYKAYLAPAAVAEIFSTLTWGGFSAGAFKKGRSGLQKLATDQGDLSPKVTIRENFAMGLSPVFNEQGEVSSEQIPLIESGKLKQWLTHSRSAKEFNLTSNFAAESESPRSLELLPGTLKSEDILKKLDQGLYLNNLHYINWSDQITGRLTGMTRYACFWVENGEIVGPIEDMRFDETAFHILGSGLDELTESQEFDTATGTYYHRSLGGKLLPGLLVNDFSLTL